MWRQKSNRAIPDRHPRCRAWLRTVWGLALLAVAGCGRAAPETDPRPAALSVMSFNVDAYGYFDRSGDGQAVELKPEAERAAVIGLIADVRPDVLALQEMGGPLVFEAFQQDLAAAGLSYEHAALLQRDRSEQNLAVLSRYPFAAVERHTDDTYRVDGTAAVVQRGFLEVDVALPRGGGLRLIVVQLKSKTFHPLGQTEMRRNEARLLSQLVRRSLDEHPDRLLLVTGDLQDHVHSAPVRLLLADPPGLHDLRPADAYGEYWTMFDAEAEIYQRTDYLLASPALYALYRTEQSSMVRHPLNATASRHRPLLAVFEIPETP